jgi:hypothetical protein
MMPGKIAQKPSTKTGQSEVGLTPPPPRQNEWVQFNAGIRETFELNQLKSAPSQLLPVSPGFDWLQTCCHSFILYFFSSAG